MRRARPPSRANLHGKWDMSKERAFMEDLLNKRFNFFLIFYSLVIAGYIKTSDKTLKIVILMLGAAISILLAITIARAGRRLKIIIVDCLYHDALHPVTVIRRKIKGPSVRWIIAYAIPAFCCATLLAAISAWSLGVLP